MASKKQANTNAGNSCSQCGNPLPAGTFDCAICWARGTPLEPDYGPGESSPKKKGIPLPVLISAVIGLPILCLIVVIAIVLSGTSEAEQVEAEPKEPEVAVAPKPAPPPVVVPKSVVSGVWYGNRDYGAGPIESWLTINADSEQPTATVRLADSPELPLGQIAVDGNRVTFTIMAPVDEQIVQVDAECQVDGDTMTGTLTIHSGEEPEVHEFEATRSK